MHINNNIATIVGIFLGFFWSTHVSKWASGTGTILAIHQHCNNHRLVLTLRSTWVLGTGKALPCQQQHRYHHRFVSTLGPPCRVLVQRSIINNIVTIIVSCQDVEVHERRILVEHLLANNNIVMIIVLCPHMLGVQECRVLEQCVAYWYSARLYECGLC